MGLGSAPALMFGLVDVDGTMLTSRYTGFREQWKLYMKPGTTVLHFSFDPGAPEWADHSMCEFPGFQLLTLHIDILPT